MDGRKNNVCDLLLAAALILVSFMEQLLAVKMLTPEYIALWENVRSLVAADKCNETLVGKRIAFIVFVPEWWNCSQRVK